MELTVRDVAELLSLSESMVYRLVKQGDLPVHKVGEQYCFHRMEILEWATANSKKVSASSVFDGAPNTNNESLAGSLQSGGIVYNLEGNDKHTVLRNAVASLNLPDAVDRAHLLDLLLARESIASTAIGDGIAIPHVRHPIVLHIERPTITLCFLKSPVNFDSLDGKPVHSLFMMVSPTVRTHLQVISRLAFALKDERLRKTLEQRRDSETIFAEISRIEQGLCAAKPASQHRE